MEENKNIFDDKQFREFLQGSKLKASENLQHRIMHQIETEQALKPKKLKSTRPLMRSLLNIAVVFYILIIALCVGAYYIGGFDMIKSTDFLLFLASVTSGCAIYTLVIVLDEKRYLK